MSALKPTVRTSPVRVIAVPVKGKHDGAVEESVQIHAGVPDRRVRIFEQHVHGFAASVNARYVPFACAAP